MAFLRHAIRGVAIAALIAGSAARSEPPVADAQEAESGATAAGLYRAIVRPAASPGGSHAFTLDARLQPAIEPDTAAALAQRPVEALAPSRDAPYLARKEMSVSYASDGRVSASLATLEPGSAPHSAGGPGATPASVYFAKGAESPEVVSLLGQLKTRGLKLALDDGWKLDAGARSREYSNAALNSRVGHVTLRRGWGDFSTAYSVQLEKRGGWNVAPSQAVTLGYALAPRSVVGLSYTTGQEIALFGAQGMLKTEVRALALQGEHAVDKRWSVNFDAGYYGHGELPAHRAVRIGFRCSL